jgi:hypothetical protein
MTQSNSIHALLMVSLVATLSTACADGGGPDDAGPEGEAAFGGLDANGDGELNAADANQGALAIYYVRLASDGEPEADGAKGEQTLTAELTPGGSGGWTLNAKLDDDSQLSIRFENTAELSVMKGAVTNVNLNPVDNAWFGYVGSPGASVEITEVDTDPTTASGALDGEIEVEQFGMNEQPLGTSIVIKGFGFKQISVDLAD